MAARKAREHRKQGAVGAEEAAVGPGHEHADGQEHARVGEDFQARAEAEDLHEGIEAADHEPDARRREEHGQPEVEERHHAQDGGRRPGNLYRLQDHQVLDRAEGTDAGAEGPAEEERGGER